MHRLFLVFSSAALQLTVAALQLSAADNCPFVNAATAAGAVGGPVVATFVSSSPTNDDGACRFTRRQAALTSELGIDVVTMSDRVSQFGAYLAKCTSGRNNLVAIGNEAIACSQTVKPGERIERIVGRVRDRAFTIRLSSNDPAATPDLLRAKLISIAEQVAGILF